MNPEKKVGQLQKEIDGYKQRELLLKSLIRMTTLRLGFTQAFPITKRYQPSIITLNQK